MVGLSAEVLEVLAGPALAHLVTVNPDGAPQVSCVWVGVEDGEICCASIGPRRKIDNVTRDPRVALSLEAPGTNPMGLRHHLVVHGRARVTEGGAPELLGRLAHTYLGPGVKFPPVDDPPPGAVIRVTPERVGGGTLGIGVFPPARDWAPPSPADHQGRPAGPQPSSITLRMPSWACIKSKPRLTSSRVMRWEMKASTSISPAR